MRSKKIDGRPAFAFSALLCLVFSMALVVPAWSTIEIGAETMSCGGGHGEGGTLKVHDSIAQGPIGEMAEGGSIRAYDGFFLVLPGINVPVEGAFFAEPLESGSVVLRWTVGALGSVTEINIYRAISAEGPFLRVNEESLPVESPGSFEDSSVWPETVFWYEVRLLLSGGEEDVLFGSPAMVTTIGRLALRLEMARPNPFHDATSLRFDVPDHTGRVMLGVFSLSGREVRRLVDGTWDRGRHELSWDGRDSRGKTVSSGVYFVRLEVDGERRIQKVMVMR
jgi:hypothetical protein